MSINQTHIKSLLNRFNIRFKNQKQNTLSFAEINILVDNTMSILDEEFQVPENLTERILANKIVVQPGRILKINFADYAQIAAVLAIGVFMGVVLGKNANTDLLASNEAKKKKILIEYLNSHHLTVDRTYFLK